jgi:glycosyltransferase involved in cell wall biosynthesis
MIGRVAAKSGVADLIDISAEVAVIRASGLFLPAWYLSRQPQMAARGEDGVEHFCRTGWREGAQPNPYFLTQTYLERNPDVARAGFNPLWHYIEFGEFEGRDPGPFFFVNWYRAEYRLGPRDPCLRHYLERRLTGQVSPVPIFDGAWYLENNPDIAAAHVDPFEHFLGFGALEGRDPSPDFDVRFYLNRYAEVLGGQNPLLHYLANRDSGLYEPHRPVHEELIPGAVRHATRPAPEFEAFQPVAATAPRKAKLLAFYLPQFHQVPENDAWWGKGFTDWTNLGRALPRFVGHLQPRVPRDLGFYSLDDPNTLRRQIEMAKGAGLAGFVFYYYWFNTHRLLEKPLERLLADPALDFPFCVMWANENWTRRWDGLEREVLIAQEYRPRDDAALVASFARLFADARYIRVQGRPLLMIYRVTLVPDAAARIAAWREIFRRGHGEDPLIIMAQSLGDFDPVPYGLDGAVEFPPHKLAQDADKINADLDLLDPDFAAAVYDYEDIAKISLGEPVPDFPLIKTVVPGWDNDPRREGQGLVLQGATPEKYQTWLEKLIAYTARNDFFGERIICVNAWNEWAEGAFLEPDIHFGAAFLNATSRALCDRNVSDLPAGILLVGHDAHPHGAQMLLLHIARQLSRQWGIAVHVLLLGVGPLLGQYYETASVSIAYDKASIGKHLDKYKRAGIRTALVNSAASARVVPWAIERGISATLLVHEMPRLLEEYNLGIQASLGAAAATNTIFSSDFVRRRFYEAVGLAETGSEILPQGNYQRIGFDASSRAEVRRALGIAESDFMVLGVGFGDIRKGFDLFVQMARKLDQKNVHFVWVGDIQPTLSTYLRAEIAAASRNRRFHHIGFTDAVAQYYAAADLYALTSREDPYPTVVLEALGCGVPCVAFDETGGIPELLRAGDAGAVVPLGDTDAFIERIILLLNRKVLKAMRPRLIALAAQFDFPRYVERLLRIAAPALQTISVCVLNYNYGPYLEGRLNSIFAQSYPVQEILLLDDASTDDSLAVAARVAEEARRDVTIIANERNAGSVFAQWRRAAESARGDYIWIAEADDDSDPAFLARLVAAMAAAEAPILAFSDSRAIDENGATTLRSYQPYYFESGAGDLADSATWPAAAFAARFLDERNLILNVSAVLWRRDALLDAMRRCGEDLLHWRVAGDWRLYLELLAGRTGSVVYVAAPLNAHRRHAQSVTHKLDAQRHVEEIRKVHRIAAEKLQLNAAALARQAAYAEQVETLLGLTPKARTKPAKPRAVAAIVATRRKV